MTTLPRINCRACIHFFITWDNRHPYGCRKMGFKGPMLPSITVRKSSGQPCLHFQAKTPDKRKPSKTDIIA
ncbi:uracil-DNA glycosylase [Desulfoluna butyratoxydans]|uniref:uracil-DNA glycosylase n=1 Tax=Desulfoluna butyratoxydans TaxID=231438 RepID=UPI0015D27EA2|nr:uracil-DNA glycosylase [Desulfoluna butyratoxydans]